MAKSPRVLHITTSIEGGAGIAARRLHEAILNEGGDSHILVLAHGNEKTGTPNLHSLIPRLLKGVLTRAYRKIYKAFGIFRYVNVAKDVEGEFEIFTTPYTHFRPEWSSYVRNADIIHLHWIANFINYKTFFKAIKGKKVVWTLHDMNPFMGGFHYKGDRERNPGLKKLENTFREEKMAALDKQELRVVYLNDWMKEEAAKDERLAEFKSFVIPNPINLNAFKVLDRDKVRASYGITPEDKVVLFASQSLSNKRKGFDLLVESLQFLRDQKLTLLTFGGGNPDFSVGKIRHIHLGSITAPEVMSRVYNCADIFLLPTREDNLPNVMLEAWACGVPVISFDNGGMRNYIESGMNGELVSVGDVEQFARMILIALSKNYDSAEIRNFAERHFSPKKVAKQFMDVVYPSRSKE